MTFAQHPGFAVIGLDVGNGKFMAAATDQVYGWEVTSHSYPLNVTSISGPPAVYVPGPREIEMILKTSRLEMTEGPDFSRALAALTDGWKPSVLRQLRGQAALMAVAQDYSW